MKKLLVLMVVGFSLMVIVYRFMGMTLARMAYGPGSKPCTCYGLEHKNGCFGVVSTCTGLKSFKVFSKTARSDNLTFGEIIVNGNIYNLGENLYLRSTNDVYKHCVGKIEVDYSWILDNGISVFITSEQLPNGKFSTLEAPGRREFIKDGTCIKAPSFCTEVNYEYCFKADLDARPPRFTYAIKQTPTMAKP